MTPDSILVDAQDRMEKAIEHLKNEFRGVRTGRASTALVEYIKADYYGSPTELKALASISVPEPTQLLIKPFDAGALGEIRKAIEELEAFVRRELNTTAQRRMGVLRPLKLVLTNWPTDQAGDPVVEHFEVANNPENEADGTREVAFSGELWIEQDDFAEVPAPKFFRLSPGREVRLRGAYFVTATDVVKDADGNVVQVNATYDPESRGGNSPDGRKVKSTMHWVSASHAAEATVHLYDRLFTTANPGAETGEALDDLNPASREVLQACKLEASLTGAQPGEVVQFERLGYFAADHDMVFHRTVGLRDEWAAIQKRG